MDFYGISNINGTYKNRKLRKIDVLNRFRNTDLKDHLTDIKIYNYWFEIKKLIKIPSMTLIIRILTGSSSKRVTEEMKKLPFWSLLNKEKYPGLRASHLSHLYVNSQKFY